MTMTNTQLRDHWIRTINEIADKAGNPALGFDFVEIGMIESALLRTLRVIATDKNYMLARASELIPTRLIMSENHHQ
jgi:hypothetical protein